MDIIIINIIMKTFPNPRRSSYPFMIVIIIVANNLMPLNEVRIIVASSL